MDDLAEKLYYKEIERRSAYSQYLSIPIGVWSLLLGGLGYISNVTNSPRECWEWVVLLLAAIALVLALAFLILSVYNYPYNYLPSPNKLQEYKKILKNHYRGYKKGRSLAKSAFCKYLRDEMIKCADINTLLNDKKSGYLNRAAEAMIAALIFLSIVASPYLLGIKSIKSTPVKVELVRQP